MKQKATELFKYIKEWLMTFPKKQILINLLIFIPIFITLVLIDQLTKSWAFNGSHIWSNHHTEWKNSFVGIRLVGNTGMFSSLGDGIGFAGVQTITSFIAIIMFTFMFFSRNWLQTVALSFLFSGAMGNIIDRYLPHEFEGEIHVVRDWIFTPWTEATSKGGTYNVADIQVMVGASFMLINIAYQTFIKKEK